MERAATEGARCAPHTARWHGRKVRRYGPGPDYRRIYLVCPRHPDSLWSLQGTVELFGARTLMPSSALATLMALTPPGVSVEYVLGDENVRPLDLALPCDLVAITGWTLHAAQVRELCRSFRERGVPVALGGAYATLHPDDCAGLADHLFVGEAEYTWPAFLRRFAGAAPPPGGRHEQREFVDLADSPCPDWSIVRAADYLNMTVQTSRGCPHRCDFCDAIQLVGRRYRTKSIEQILIEVAQVHAAGARTVFFSDDNFLGRREFTRQLLRALVAWNRARERPLTFSTQITMQVADDDELLRLMADARFSTLFLGLEAVRRECLDEVHKGHNLSHDPAARIHSITRHGLVPFLGLILGFDHDDAGVFDEVEAFLDEVHCPIAGVNLLNAPYNTPLYRRLQAEGRLVEEDFSGEWNLQTNIIPRQMSRDELYEGYWRLLRRIYAPERFEARMVQWLDEVERDPVPYEQARFDAAQLLRMGSIVGYMMTAPAPVRSLFMRRIREGWRDHPRLMGRVLTLLCQYRHFHDFAHRGDEGPLPAVRS